MARVYLTQSAEVVCGLLQPGRGSNVAGQSLLLRPRSGFNREQKRCSVVSCGGAKQGECPHEPSSLREGWEGRASLVRGQQTLASQRFARR